MSGTAFFPLGGGLDLVTPAVAINPGRVVASLNYEPVQSGYARTRGFERFDGGDAPSAVRVFRLNFAGGSWQSPPTVGGLNANSTYALVAPPVVTDGDPAMGTAVGYLFVAMKIGAPPPVTSYIGANQPQPWSAQTTDDPRLEGDPDLRRLGGEAIRPYIAPVPGTGPIRGIWFNLDRCYAVRDSDDGATYIYRSTLEADNSALGGSTWRRLGYRAVDGNEVTTQPANIGSGRCQFITHNFYGNPDQERVYGVSGAGKAFSINGRVGEYGGGELAPGIFDGAAVEFISTGTADGFDKPTRVAAHKNALFLAFPGGSVQYSQPGEPESFNAALGAGEFATGDETTDFLVIQNALAILGATSIHVLYGNDTSDYQLETLSDEAGGLAWTAQRIGQPIYLDNVGLRALSATASYGNFSIGTLSGLIEPLLADLRRDRIDPSASLVVRSRNQYWLFFEDGQAIVFLFGKKQVEALPLNLGIAVTCAASVEYQGVERVFVGAADGFVYELNRGTSFDGNAITSYIRLAFNHLGTPQKLKRAHKVVIDLEASSPTTLAVSVDVDFGSVPGTVPQVVQADLGGAALFQAVPLLSEQGLIFTTEDGQILVEE